MGIVDSCIIAADMEEKIMSEMLKQKLKENGADVEGTLHRFMNNDKLFLKFILKYKDDKNCALLTDALDQKNYEEAFKAAHTLKGVSANLGLNPIFDRASAITELLRGKEASEVDAVKIEEEKKALEEAHQLFLKIIEENA